MMLVTVEQLETRLRKTLDAGQATQEIELASAVIAAYCNLVTLDDVTDDEITLTGVYGPRLPLPGGPVTEVSEVTVDGTTVTDYWLVKDVLHRGRSNGTIETPIFGEHYSWGGPDIEIGVTYTHGFADVPMAIQAHVLAMAARTWANPSGARQQTIDGYSVTWANGMLTPEDKTGLYKYHRSAYSANTS